MATDDGGHAFPGAADTHEGHQMREYGMTLRDYFAGQALAGLSANPVFDLTVEVMSEWAYEQADAMIATRTKEPT